VTAASARFIAAVSAESSSAARVDPQRSPTVCGVQRREVLRDHCCDNSDVYVWYSGASPGRKQWGGQKARVGLMASAEGEPITGVWGQSPQWGPGAEPLVRESGGEAPLKLKAFCRWTTQTMGKICHFNLVFLKLPSKPKIVVEMDRICELLVLESFSDYCK